MCRDLDGKGIVPYNNFPNKVVDHQIKLYLQNINKINNTKNNNNTNRINPYYRNQMHYYNKLDEEAITNFIERQIIPIEKQN